MPRPPRWARAALVWLAVFLPLAPVAAQVQIEAPHFTFDRVANRYLYEDGSITLGGLRLFASRMELNATTGILQASGLVRVETASLTGFAEAAEFDTRSGQGRMERVDLYTHIGLYVRAEELLIHPDGTLEFRRCTLTTCPPHAPGWRMDASTLTLGTGDLGVAWNPRMWLEGLPVLYLPVIAWPTVGERRTGLLSPELDRDESSLQRQNLGWRFKLPLFLNLGEDHDLTLTPEVIQHRGLALEAQYNYAFIEGQRGTLTLWGIPERDARDPAEENTALLSAVPPPGEPLTRYRLDWGHNQPLGEPGRLVASLHHGSDGQVRQEYDGIAEYRPYRTYQASLTGQWQWVAAALTFEQTSDYLEHSVYADSEAFTDTALRPQLLPRLTARLGGRLSERLPLAAELELSATRFVAEQAIGGQLYTASPSLALPLALGGAFELRPRLTRHHVRYTALSQFDSTLAAPTSLADEAFAQSEHSLELRTTLARVFPLEAGRAGALKHRIVPRLIYSEVEDVPQPVALRDQVLHPRVAKRLLTLRMDTDLLRRDRDPDSSALGQAFGDAQAPLPWQVPAPRPVREVLRASVIQRYNFLLEPDAPALRGPTLGFAQETEPGEPLLPLLLELQVFGEGYGVSARMNHHHQLDRTTEASLAVSGSVRPGTGLSFSYDFNELNYATPEDTLRFAVNAFSFGGQQAVSDTVTAGLSGRVNLQDGALPLDRRIDQVGMFISYHPACYTLSVNFVEAVAATVEGGEVRFYEDRSIKIIFTLGGLVGGRSPQSLATQVPPGMPGAAYASAPSPAGCNG